MKFRINPTAGSVPVIVVAIIVLMPLLSTSAMADPADPPAGNVCDMRCWAELRKCVGQCHIPGSSKECERMCNITYDMCLWRCDVLPPKSWHRGDDIFADQLLCVWEPPIVDVPFHR